MDLIKRVFIYLIFIILFSYVAVPSLIPILASFTRRWYNTVLPEEYTLTNYYQVFTRRDIVPSLLSSLFIGFMTVAMALIIIFPATIYFALNPKSKIGILVDIVTLAPIMIPPLIIALAILTLYVDTPLRDSFFIVVFAHLILSTPYVFRVLRSGAQLLDIKTLIEAARSLGATPLQAYVRVIIPLLAPHIASSMLMAFAISVGDFEMANILAPWRYQTAPIRLYQLFYKDSWLASALASILIMVSVSSFVLITVITRKSIGRFTVTR